MSGSTLEAMALAVEGAAAVLLCISKRYKESQACRAEAEYAYQQRKRIIPIMMERGYRCDHASTSQYGLQSASERVARDRVRNAARGVRSMQRGGRPAGAAPWWHLASLRHAPRIDIIAFWSYAAGGRALREPAPQPFSIPQPPLHRPTGWLGILIGTKLYFDCSERRLIPERMGALERELGPLARQCRRHTTSTLSAHVSANAGGGGGGPGSVMSMRTVGGGAGSMSVGVVGRHSRRTSTAMPSPPASMVGASQPLHYTPQELQQHTASLAYQNQAQGSATSLPQLPYPSQGPGPVSSHTSPPLPHHAWGSQVSLHSMKNIRSHAQHAHQQQGQHTHGSTHSAGHHLYPHPHHHKAHYMQFAEAAAPGMRNGPAAAAAAAAALQGRGGLISRGLSPHIPEESSLTELDLCMGVEHSPRPQPPRGTRGRMSLDIPRTQVGAFGVGAFGGGAVPAGAAGGPWVVGRSSFRSLMGGAEAELEPWSEATVAPSSLPMPPPLAAFEGSPTSASAAHTSAPSHIVGRDARRSGGGGMGMRGVAGLRAFAGQGHGQSETPVASGELGSWHEAFSETTAEREWLDHARDPLALPPLSPLEEQEAAAGRLPPPAAGMVGRAAEVVGVVNMSRAADEPAAGTSAEGPVVTVDLGAAGGTREVPATPGMASALNSASAADAAPWEARAQPAQRSPLQLLLQQHQARLAAEDGAGRHHAGTMSGCSSNGDLAALTAATAMCGDGSSAAGSSGRSSRLPTPPRGATHGRQPQPFEAQEAASGSVSVCSHTCSDPHHADLHDMHGTTAANGTRGVVGNAQHGAAAAAAGSGPAKGSLDFGVLATAQTEVASQPFIRRSALRDSWEEDTQPPAQPAQLQQPKQQQQQQVWHASSLYAVAPAAPRQQEARRSGSHAAAASAKASASAGDEGAAAEPAAAGVEDDSASPLLMVTLSSMPSNLSDDMLLPGLPRAFDESEASPHQSPMARGAALAAAHADVDAAAPVSGGSFTDQDLSPKSAQEQELEQEQEREQGRGGGEGEGSGPEAAAARSAVAKWRSMPGTPCDTPYASSLGSAGSYASANNSVTSAQGLCLVAAALHPHHNHHSNGHQHRDHHNADDSAPRLVDNFASEASSAGPPGPSAAAEAAAACLVEPESGNDDMSSIEPSPQVRSRQPHRLAIVDAELDSQQQSGSGQDPSMGDGRGGTRGCGVGPGVTARRQASAPHAIAAAGLRHAGTSTSLTAPSECAASDYPGSGHGVGYAGAPSDVDSVAMGADTDIFTGSGPSIVGSTAGAAAAAAAAAGAAQGLRARRQGSAGVVGAPGSGPGAGGGGGAAGGLTRRWRSRLALCSAAAEGLDDELDEAEENEDDGGSAGGESSDVAEVAAHVSALMPGPCLSRQALAATQGASRTRRELLRREKGHVLPLVSGGSSNGRDEGRCGTSVDAEEGEEAGMIRLKASGSGSLEADGGLPSHINGDLLGLPSAWGRDAAEQFVHVLSSGPLPTAERGLASPGEGEGDADAAAAAMLVHTASIFTTAAATASAPSSVASSQRLPNVGQGGLSSGAGSGPGGLPSGIGSGPAGLPSGGGSGRYGSSSHWHSSVLGPLRSGPGGANIVAADFVAAFGSVMPTAPSGRVSSEGQRSLSHLSSDNVTANWLSRLSASHHRAMSPGRAHGPAQVHAQARHVAPPDSGTSGVAASTPFAALASAAGSLPLPGVPPSQPASSAVPAAAAPAGATGAQAGAAALPPDEAPAAPAAPATYLRTPLLASLLRPVTAVLASVVGGRRSSGTGTGRSCSGAGKKSSRAASLAADGATPATGRGSSVDSMFVNVGDAAAAGAAIRTSEAAPSLPSARGSAARGSIEAHPVMFDSDPHDSHPTTGEAGLASPATTAHGELSSSEAVPAAAQCRSTTTSMDRGSRLGAFGSPCLDGAGSASLGHMALAAAAVGNRAAIVSPTAAASASGFQAGGAAAAGSAAAVVAAPQGRHSLSGPQLHAGSVAAAGVVSPFAASAGLPSQVERPSLEKSSVAVVAAAAVSMSAANGALQGPAAGPAAGAAAAPQSALVAAKWKALSWARGSPSAAEAAAAAVTAARGALPNALVVAMASAASGVDGDADDLVGERLAMLLDGSGRRSLAVERRPAAHDVGDDGGVGAGRGAGPTRLGRVAEAPGSAYEPGPAPHNSRRSVDIPWSVWRSGAAPTPQFEQVGGGAAAAGHRRGPEYPALDDGEASHSDVVLEEGADGLAAAQQALLQQGSAWRAAASAPPAPGMLAAARANSRRSVLSNGSAGGASASGGRPRRSRPASVLGGGAAGGVQEGEDEFRDAMEDASHERALMVIGSSSRKNAGVAAAGDDTTGELAEELLGEERDPEDEHDGDADERGRDYDGYDGYDEFYDGDENGFGTPGRPRVSGEGALGYGELGGAASGGLDGMGGMGGGEHHGEGGEEEEAVDVPSSTSVLVEKWGGAQVRDWLVRVGHGELADGFEEQGITGEVEAGRRRRGRWRGRGRGLG